MKVYALAALVAVASGIKMKTDIKTKTDCGCSSGQCPQTIINVYGEDAKIYVTTDKKGNKIVDINKVNKKETKTCTCKVTEGFKHKANECKVGNKASCDGKGEICKWTCGETKKEKKKEEKKETNTCKCLVTE